MREVTNSDLIAAAIWAGVFPAKASEEQVQAFIDHQRASKMVKYAVRHLGDNGEWAYRSMHNASDHFATWADAQLWNNRKQAEKEAEALRKGRPDMVEHWVAKIGPEKAARIVSQCSPKPSAVAIAVEFGAPE